jgi:hypothetical protein
VEYYCTEAKYIYLAMTNAFYSGCHFNVLFPLFSAVQEMPSTIKYKGDYDFVKTI